MAGLLGELVEGQLFALEIIEALKNVLAGKRARERRFDNSLLALFDGSGEPYFTLAVEKTLLAHLAKIDLDRIPAVRAFGIVLVDASGGSFTFLIPFDLVFLKVNFSFAVEYFNIHIFNQTGHCTTIGSLCGQNPVEFILSDVAAILT